MRAICVPLLHPERSYKIREITITFDEPLTSTHKIRLLCEEDPAYHVCFAWAGTVALGEESLAVFLEEGRVRNGENFPAFAEIRK